MTTSWPVREVTANPSGPKGAQLVYPNYQHVRERRRRVHRCSSGDRASVVDTDDGLLAG